MKKGRKNICPRCRSEIPEGMTFCQFCMEVIENNGGVVEIESRYKPKINKWFMAFVTAALCILFIMFAAIIFMLSNLDKKETPEQPFSEISTTEQAATVQETDLNAMTTASAATASTITDTTTVSTAADTAATSKEIINTAPAQTAIAIPDTEEVFADDTTIPEQAVTEPETKEMPAIKVSPADFEAIIRNGFDSWLGLGDTETLSFSGYSCTFSNIIQGEHINCTLTAADDLKSYVLTMSGDEYSTGSFRYGIDRQVNAFAEIVLGYKPTFMGSNIRSGIREIFSDRGTLGHIIDEDFGYDIEYDSDTNTVTINAYELT